MTHHKTFASTRVLALLGLVATAALAPSARAGEFEYVGRAGVAYSDNVLRYSRGNEQSGTALMLGAQLRGVQPTGRLRYDLAADLARFEYLTNGEPGQTAGRAAAQGSYDLFSDVLSWNAGLSYDQIRDDILRPLAPGNTESEITLSTGPTLNLRFSPTTRAQADANYTHVSYSRRPLDNETLGGRVQLIRDASSRAQWGLGASYDDVSYTSSAASVSSTYDFRREEAFARMVRNGVRSSLEIEAGYADVNGASVDDSGFMMRSRLTRRLSPSINVHVAYIREYPTSEQTPIPFTPNATTPGGAVTDPSLLTAAPRLAQVGEAGFHFARTRTSFDLVYAHHEENSLVPGIGRRNFDDVRVAVTRDFTPNAWGSLYGSVSREKFSLFGRSFDEQSVGGLLARALGPQLALEGRVEYHNRSAALASQEYNEFNAGIYVRYTSRPRRGSQGMMDFDRR